MRRPPSDVGPRPAAKSRQPARARAAAAAGGKGVLVKVAGQEDRDLAKRGRSLKSSHHQGDAISRRGSRPVGWGVDDKGVEGAIPKELKVSGPRAKARGQVEGREPGGDPADRRPDVARVAMPKDMGRGRRKRRGNTPAGEKLAARLLRGDHSRAGQGGKEHGEMLCRGHIGGQKGEVGGRGPRARMRGVAKEGRKIARRQEEGPPTGRTTGGGHKGGSDPAGRRVEAGLEPGTSRAGARRDKRRDCPSRGEGPHTRAGRGSLKDRDGAD